MDWYAEITVFRNNPMNNSIALDWKTIADWGLLFLGRLLEPWECMLLADMDNLWFRTLRGELDKKTPAKGDRTVISKEPLTPKIFLRMFG